MEREAYQIVKQAEKTIERHQMLQGCSRVIVALSGGADSVCLLSIFRHLSQKYSIAVEAAHVNHNLRGEASEADEAFVRALCRKWDVPLFVKSVDVRSISEKEKNSVEEAGRNVRYAFFDELANADPCIRIATAHTRNDNAETMVMHFLRGAGINGLSGIPYVRGNIIRPVLDLTREQIERYNQIMTLDFVTDQTNKENIVTRNRVRNRLLPQLAQEYNPNLIQTLARSSDFMRIDEEFLEQECGRFYRKALVERTPNVLLFQRELMRKAGFSMCIRLIRKAAQEQKIEIFPDSEWFYAVWEMICGDVSRKIFYQDRLCICAEGESVRIFIPNDSHADVREFVCRLELEKWVYCEQLQKKVRMEMQTGRLEQQAAWRFDADRIKGNVVIRSRLPGDWFCPLGTGGHKKVKDYLIDKKIPRSERNQIPIISCDAGIMQVGDHVDSGFCVLEDTKNILLIKLEEKV